MAAPPIPVPIARDFGDPLPNGDGPANDHSRARYSLRYAIERLRHPIRRDVASYLTAY